jgi:serine/threonine protein kinase
VEGHLLLTDFGLSKVALDSEDERTNSVLGTIEYMAPEVIEGKPYDFSVDWWGLGAIGFDLLTGSPPFGGNNHAKIQHNILTQKLKLPYFLGPDAKDLLTRLLRKEPQKRLGGTTSKDIKVLKAHRFFRKIDWKKLETRELEPVSVLLIYLFTRLPADFPCLANSACHYGSCVGRKLQQRLHGLAIESGRCSRW